MTLRKVVSFAFAFIIILQLRVLWVAVQRKQLVERRLKENSTSQKERSSSPKSDSRKLTPLRDNTRDGSTQRRLSYDDFTPNCSIVNIESALDSDISTPFKVYIYDLPARFNADLVECIGLTSMKRCNDLSNCGFGFSMSSKVSMSSMPLIDVRDTWQFSLEVLIHHKLLFSPYRTLDPSKADVFYVPYYGALDCFCSRRKKNASESKLSTEVFTHIKQKYPYFNQRFPHVSTLGKIQREEASTQCPILLNGDAKTLTYIAIEQEANRSWQRYMGMLGTRVIVAPYPSYGHLVSEKQTTEYIKTLEGTKRTVVMFLAAANRRSNNFRSKILDQMNQTTSSSYEEYWKKQHFSEFDQIQSIQLVTPECRGQHKYRTITWMQKSQFCLQPPGDSPTRKSFYDAVISGCIPVIFKMENVKVAYPFQNRMNYTDFCVVIPDTDIKEKGLKVLDILKKIDPQTVQALRTHLMKVLPFLQYDFPITNSFHKDAMQYIIDDIKGSIKIKDKY